MLFNSLIFIGFFVIVYVIYLTLYKKTKSQNILLLLASYVFYGYWDWRFLFLIAFSTLADFCIGLLIEYTNTTSVYRERRRKLLLATSVIINLGILAFFKYFNFFTNSFADMLGLFGLHVDTVTLKIILPIGISFYTFQTMSYTIDIYRGRLKATHNLIDFAVFVAFFPQLVAGPIERARHLLPQVQNPRHIKAEMVDVGLFLILWGYFKKVIIADHAGIISDQIFNNFTEYQGLDIFVGVLAFSIQIYGDFSGYSDIARGISRLLGFDLMVNFRLPYFSLNPSDFWQRWHISLSTWLRDYLYIPLGGNRGGSFRTHKNLMITMLLGGLWHGASWNFVIWGGFHGAILVIYRLFEKESIQEDPWNGHHPRVLVLGKMLLMFMLTLVGWFLFRVTSINQIVYMIENISITLSDQSLYLLLKTFILSFPIIVVQICQYYTKDLLILCKMRSFFRIPCYSMILILIIIFGVRDSIEFIYFQF